MSSGPSEAPAETSTSGQEVRRPEPQIDTRRYYKALQNLNTIASWDPKDPSSVLPEKVPLQMRTKVLLNSTLAQYGLYDKRPPPKKDPLDAAPNFKAFLERQKQRDREILAVTPIPPPAVPCRPYSYEDFMRRLATFKLTTYREQTPGLDAPAAAGRGWTNDGRNRLVCESCKAAWVLEGEKGLSKEALEELHNRQRRLLVDSHHDTCAWKVQECDPSIYKLPMKSREGIARVAVDRAITITPLIEGIELSLPIPESDVSTILDWIHKIVPPTQLTPGGQTTSEPQYSDKAVLLGLFGWTASTLDASQAPEPPRRARPAIPASSPVSVFTPNLSATTARNGILHPSSTAASPTPSPRTSSPSTPSSKKPVLQCVLCHAKIALWSIPRHRADSVDVDSSPPVATATMRRVSGVVRDSRKLDPTREHQPYCPYVTRTTPLSAFTIQLDNAAGSQKVEGWRAVVHVMTRRTTAERTKDRQAARRKAAAGGEGDMDVDEREKDDVEAVVDYVEKHGGRDLVRYVTKMLK